MEDFTVLAKAYLELGVLGLLAVTFVLLVILLVRKLLNSSGKREELTNTQYTQLLNMVTEQNKQLTDTLIDNSKTELEKAIKEIVNHTPTSEENERQIHIDAEIDNELQQILLASQADRVCIVQYHNGGRGLNKQSFLKMSVTNEQVQVGIKQISPMFKDQFRNVLAYFVRELSATSKCYIPDTESIKEVDSGMYEFLASRGIKSKYGMAIKNKDEVVIGFVCVEYEKNINKNVKEIDFILKEHHHTLESLLNL